MVFIAMDEDDLLARTAKYQIQYKKLSRHSAGRSAVSDSFWSRNPRWRQYSHAARRGAALLEITPMDEDDNVGYHLEEREAQMPHEFTTTALPPCRVSIECSEDEAEARVDRPPRIDALAFEREPDMGHESDSSDGIGYMPTRNDDPWDLELLTSARDFRSDRDRSRTSRESSTLSDTRGPYQTGTHHGIKAANGSGGALMAPHTKFHTEKGRPKCTIRFDPPISGRFILLKMWSPGGGENSNIDIQAVVAKGFAGPRYFPAVSML
jgi:hypothetical protein